MSISFAVFLVVPTWIADVQWPYLKEFYRHNICTSGYCTKLHPVWFYLTTETTFSVSTGTLITVKCHDGLTNIGSEIITCQNKIHYKFDVEPGCEPKGEILQQIFVKNFVNKFRK